MRVCIIHQNAYTPSQSAGTRHYEMARELRSRGHDVLIIASSFYHKERRETRLRHGETMRKEIVAGVPYLWLRAPAYRGNGLGRVWNMAMFSRRVYRSAECVRQFRPDVILASTPPIFASYAALRVARRIGVPLVLEVRDLWPETLVCLGGMWRINPLIVTMSWMEKRLYRSARGIVSLLPDAAGHIVRKGGVAENIRWISNGVNLDAVPRMIPPPSGSGFTVIYAGAHGHANALETVVQCARIVQDSPYGNTVRFRLIGEGPHKRHLQMQAAEYQLTNIYFEPALPKANIHTVLAEADAFLMTLRRSRVFQHGVSPNKLFDYMAVGRPVIFAVAASNNPISEVGAGLTIPPEDPRAMAHAVIDLVRKTPDQRREMGRKGRDAVIRNYGFATLTDKLEEFLEQIAMSPHSPKDVPQRRAACP